MFKKIIIDNKEIKDVEKIKLSFSALNNFYISKIEKYKLLYVNFNIPSIKINSEEKSIMFYKNLIIFFTKHGWEKIIHFLFNAQKQKMNKKKKKTVISKELQQKLRDLYEIFLSKKQSK